MIFVQIYNINPLFGAHMLSSLRGLTRAHSGNANNATTTQENYNCTRFAYDNETVIERFATQLLHEFSLAKWTVEGFGTRQQRIEARRKIKATSSSRTERAKEITLKNLNLTTLPSFFLATFQFRNVLKYLTISHNAIEAIPREIGNLASLTFLDLSSNKLSSLPIELENLKNLKQLYLTGNKFKTIPSQVWNLTNLDTFNASENQIEKLSSEIEKLVNLTVLNLGKNLLKKLPKELGRLTDLTEITLYENQLTELPDELGDLKNLREINVVSNGELCTLPTTLQHRKGTLIVNIIGTKIPRSQL